MKDQITVVANTMVGITQQIAGVVSRITAVAGAGAGAGGRGVRPIASEVRRIASVVSRADRDNSIAGAHPTPRLLQRFALTQNALQASRRLRACGVVVITLLGSACASRSTTPPVTAPPPAGPAAPGAAPGDALPPIPAVDGPLRLNVSYPSEGGTVVARDSNFIFGSTGSGQARLTINGAAVKVEPNGGWLAFLPVPIDGVYRLQATKGAETANFERRVRVPNVASAAVQPSRPTEPVRARIISGTISPSGALAVTPNETVEVSFTGSGGGRAALVLPDGRRFPLIESRALNAAINNAADFQLSVMQSQTPAPGVSRYSGVFPAVALRSRDTTLAVPALGTPVALERPDTLLERCAAAASAGRLDQAPRCLQLDPGRIEAYQSTRGGVANIELVFGTDTVRAPLNLNLAILTQPRVGVVTSQETQPKARADYRIRGRNATSGPFHYFWPHGTMLTITGQRSSMYRVHLAPNRTAWVPVGEVRLLPEGAPLPGGGIAAVRFNAHADYIDLRVPLPDRLPYHIEETEHGLQLDVFGATSLVNFFQYGSLDPLIERAQWSQPLDSVFRVNVELHQSVWGYDAFHDQSGALILRIRRPPIIDTERPLRGLLIAVDAGHGGADSTTMGPTRFTEARANLAIAQKLRPLLEAAGARVLMTRNSDVFVDLGVRTQMAADSNAHILVSVHNNAFPDGVNPFENNGTSVYYFHPHSVDLAQNLQRELLAELRLRDIGIGRADLALVRPTWMPAALTETSFMMIPEQEAALRDPAVQERIARAHLRAIAAFVRARAPAR